MSGLLAFLKDRSIDYVEVDLTNLNAGSAVKPSTDAKSPKPSGDKSAKGGGASAEHAVEGTAKIGMEVKKTDDFSSWYQQVLTKTEMMDYYDISGCYIIRPAAYKIWKEIQSLVYIFHPKLCITYIFENLRMNMNA